MYQQTPKSTAERVAEIGKYSDLYDNSDDDNNDKGDVKKADKVKAHKVTFNAQQQPKEHKKTKPKSKKKSKQHNSGEALYLAANIRRFWEQQNFQRIIDICKIAQYFEIDKFGPYFNLIAASMHLVLGKPTEAYNLVRGLQSPHWDNFQLILEKQKADTSNFPGNLTPILLPYFDKLEQKNKPTAQPLDLKDLNSRADAALIGNDINSALALNEQALKLSKTNAQTWIVRGKIFAAKGDNEAALRYWKRAIACDIDNAEPYDLFCKTLCLLNKHGDINWITEVALVGLQHQAAHIPRFLCLRGLYLLSLPSGLFNEECTVIKSRLDHVDTRGSYAAIYTAAVEALTNSPNDFKKFITDQINNIATADIRTDLSRANSVNNSLGLSFSLSPKMPKVQSFETEVSSDNKRASDKWTTAPTRSERTANRPLTYPTASTSLLSSQNSLRTKNKLSECVESLKNFINTHCCGCGGK